MTTTLEHTLTIAGGPSTTWTPEDTAAVEEARQVFDQAKGEGMLAYAISGAEGEVIREFDETKPEIVMSRQLQGG